MKRWKTSSAALLLVLFLLSGQRVQAAQPRLLVPAGQAVGLQLNTQGVVVVRAEGGKVRAGDVIVEVNGTPVSCGDDVRVLLETLTQEDHAELLILRDGVEIKLSQTVNRTEDGSGSMGLWLRDQVTGVGTLTYVDPESGAFGALGHGVNDVDCGLRLPLRSGIVTKTCISAVLKGSAGAPGQLCGGLDTTQTVGSIKKNTAKGIFGTLEDSGWIPGQAVETASAEEICLGTAQLLSDVDGTGPKAYSVEIVRLYGCQEDGRDLMLRVTDKTLLEKTGGIVQGMSGSPILQNGKLIGAVTHVLVSQPEKGYGISIENMLKAAA